MSTQPLNPASPNQAASPRQAASGSGPLLHIDGLTINYSTDAGTVPAVRGVSLTVGRNETVALVGESGSGKSTTAHAIVRLLAANADISGGSITLAGQDLTRSSAKELRAVRGAKIGLVPQDPSVSLNPVQRIGRQVAEVLLIHGLANRKNAAELAVEALRHAGLGRPELRAQQYPHELSGGMRQRVLIAIGIIAKPALLIADEPTSALDVTVQRQILDHLDVLKRELGMSVLLITHDLGVAGDRADRIIVMSGGRVVESGTAEQVLHAPVHPYTKSLIAAAPSLNAARTGVVVSEPAPHGTAAAAGRAPHHPVLVLENLVKDFPLPRSAGGGSHRAVDDVSLAVARGRTLAIVGESGSGKSTTARLALRLEGTTSGRIFFGGDDVTSITGSRLRTFRRGAQLVHQNPYAALNPRLTVGEIVADPLDAHRIGTRVERRQRAARLLDVVALPQGTAARKPAELSGGQRQRVAIARALALEPALLVLDEPVSALDVSIQHQILTLLADIQAETGIGYLFISHDLAVVRAIAHDTLVMRDGRILESGETSAVFDRPAHDYTRELLDAIPGTRSH